MRAMVLKAVNLLLDNPRPLLRADLPDPFSGRGVLLVRAGTCGVCHTELDEIEGPTPTPRLPMILGRQVDGRVEARGQGVQLFRVGVA